MGIYKQIIFLSILLIAVMVTCVFNHIKDFENELIILDEKVENNLFDKIVNNIKNTNNNEKEIEEKVNKKEQTTEKEILKEEILIEKIEEETVEIQEKPEVVKDETIEEEKTIEVSKSQLPSNKRIEELSKRIEPKSKEIKIEEINIQKELDLIFEKEKIVFKRLSTNITDGSKVLVNKVSKVLEKYKDVKIEIGGHTDAKGKADVNQWISLQRALSVKKELIKLGISKTRIKTKGYGETKPLVPNNKKGYSMENRRVEIKVIEE